MSPISIPILRCGMIATGLFTWLWKGCFHGVTAYKYRSNSRHEGRSDRIERTVHERLRHSLQFHSDFQQHDFNRWNWNQRHDFDSSEERKIGDEQPRATTRARQASATILHSQTITDNHSHLPLTLQQAHTIHEYAIEATNGVMRSYGHVPTASCTIDSQSCSPMSMMSSRRIKRRSSSPPMTFLPTDYGADPSGINDSTAAFASLMNDLLHVTPGRKMAANITNLGGVTLNLQGGQYLISEPIIIPPFYGNIHIMDGSLQASTTSFPRNRWMIEIGHDENCRPVTPDGQDDPQKSCNELIDVTNVLLDANFVAAGGLRVSKVMGTTLDEVFITGFVQSGIYISNGHEVMISNAWLAECYWSTNEYCKQQNSSSIGVLVDGMDHYITNTIVFDYAKVGVVIRQPANLLVGVHTWNGGGHGIDIYTHTVRLIGCYLDFETLNLWNPRDILVESTFFYYGHTILHADSPSSIVDGLIMRFNHYNTNQSVVLDGSFDQIRSVSIEEEVDWVKTTKARRRLTQYGATEWNFDFTESLLFPTIDFLSYSMVILSNNSPHPTGVSHTAIQPNGTRLVTVYTSEPIDATIYVTVEQGGRYDF